MFHYEKLALFEKKKLLNLLWSLSESLDLG